MSKTSSTLKNIDELKEVAVRTGIVLRLLSHEDATRIVNILEADPEIRQRVGVVADVRKESDVRKIVDAAASDPDIIRYVIEDAGNVVGMINFWRAGEYFGDNAHPADYGFGYFLAPEARGKGLIVDSLKELMDTAERELDVHSFIAFCEDDNFASGKQLEKVGLKKTDQAWTYEDKKWKERKYEKRNT